MKKTYLVLIALTVGLFAMPAFAQTPVAGADVFAIILQYLSGIPYVGTVLAFVAKWGGLVAGLFTSLTLAVTTVLKTPELLARWAGAGALADKIQAFADEVIPWFKYLSIFNAQSSASKKMLMRHEAELKSMRSSVNQKNPSA